MVVNLQLFANIQQLRVKTSYLKYSQTGQKTCFGIHKKVATYPAPIVSTCNFQKCNRTVNSKSYWSASVISLKCESIQMSILY